MLDERNADRNKVRLHSVTVVATIVMQIFVESLNCYREDSTLCGATGKCAQVLPVVV